jgi:hypothetical protein
VKVLLDLGEEPPGAGALRRQHAATVLQAPGGPARDGAEHVQVGDQRVRGRGFRADARGPRVFRQAQDQPGVGQHEGLRRRRARDVGLVQAADLARRESMGRDRVGELDTGLRLGARQRHEVLHRGMGHDPSLADVLLDRGRQRAHQVEAPRHPAHAAIEPPRQHVEREPVVLPQGPQEPALLEHAVGGLGLEQLPQDQRVGFAQVPLHGRDRVPVQTAETADAFVPVNHDVRRRPVHDHDRHLLADVGQRGQEASLPCRLAYAQRRVPQIQLMEFELHGVRR